VTGPTGRDVNGVPVANGGPAPPSASPVDVVAILAAMQDQIDDLTAAVEAQQRTIDELVRAKRASGPDRRSGFPAAGR
jgi:hypothetical protein